MEFQEIALTTAAADLPEHTLIQFVDGTYGAVAVLPRLSPDEEGVRLSLSLGDMSLAQDVGLVSSHRELAEIVDDEAGRQSARAFRLPPGQFIPEVRSPRQRERTWQKRLAIVLLTVGVGVLCLGLAVLDPPVNSAAGYLMVAWLIAAALAWWATTDATEPGYAMNGQLWLLDQFELPEDQGLVAAHQVDAIKETYGALLSDVAYRIEFPALFDAAEPHTEELTLALFEWDSTSSRLPSDRRAALSRRVAEAFDAARAHAERVGMGHLPDAALKPAGDALGLLRRAAGPAVTLAERAAVLERVSAILDELALYYLPTGVDAREALTGRRLRELPGRRTP